MDIRDSPSLVRVQRLDTIRIDSNDSTYYTKEGYLIDRPILTTCGIFEYKNNDGSVRRELRLPDHVFSKSSLDSYKGKPIIITHDAGEVTKDNVSRVEIGTILSEGYRDGDNVRAEIVIHDTDSMKESTLKELSLGYSLNLIEEPGEYNGEHYDAIQTDIMINHLALVRSARAGENARLNIDNNDEEVLTGGLKMNDKEETLSPEELKEAIASYKESKGTLEDKKKHEESDKVNEGKNDVDKDVDSDDKEETVTDEGEGKSVYDLLDKVKENRKSIEEGSGNFTAEEIIKKQEEDIDTLLACVEKVLSEKTVEQDENSETTPTDKKEKSTVNADEADAIFRQRLSICRVGDKLNLDGLEEKSIIDGKKAIIAKVLPDMRLDGKSDTFVDACYELAINEVKKHKGVSYQRSQMMNGKSLVNLDGIENVSMAEISRKRMIGGGK